MSRTRDPVAHGARREAFLDAAQALIGARGFADVSVADVIEAVGVSKGAFYHYFPTKAALLDGVVNRLVGTTVAQVAAIAADPALDPLAAFRSVVHAMPAGQPARQDLMAELLVVWFTDENAVLRDRVRQSSCARLSPHLAGLIRRGREQGVFTPSSAEGCAVVVCTLMLDLGEAVGRLLLAHRQGVVTFSVVEDVVTSYAEAIERALGATAGAFPDDRALLRAWFEQTEKG